MKQNFTIWLTGLPCSGKTTIAKELKEAFDRKGFSTVHLDGDDVRAKLNADLGFSEKDRFENLRRVAHIARLFNENGSLVIASFVSYVLTAVRRKKALSNRKLQYHYKKYEQFRRWYSYTNIHMFVNKICINIIALVISSDL